MQDDSGRCVPSAEQRTSGLCSSYQSVTHKVALEKVVNIAAFRLSGRRRDQQSLLAQGGARHTMRESRSSRGSDMVDLPSGMYREEISLGGKACAELEKAAWHPSRRLTDCTAFHVRARYGMADVHACLLPGTSRTLVHQPYKGSLRQISWDCLGLRLFAFLSVWLSSQEVLMNLRLVCGALESSKPPNFCRT